MAGLGPLDRLAGRRQGLTTTTSLHQIGFTDVDITRLVERGILHRVRRGVLRTVGAPRTGEQAHLAAVLASGDDAVLSHLSAATFWRFRGFPAPAAIDVLREGTCRPKGPGIRGHTTTWLPQSHRTLLWDVPITTPERTFFDVCSVVPPRVLARAADDLIRRGCMTDRALRRTFDEIPASGRRAMRPAIDYLESRPIGFERGANDRELDVMRALIRAGIEPLPEQQIRVSAKHKTYKIDYGWRAIKHGLEFMGFDPHGNLRSVFHDDADRTRALQRAGWTLWPITDQTTEAELVDLATDLVALLPSPPFPP